MNIPCIFCQIANKQKNFSIIYEDLKCIAFLDHRPLFPGHTLLIPKVHVETITDLPNNLLNPFFSLTQKLSHAVEKGTSSEGTFIAINNRVSQSVPHLHVHIVPRNKGDGLRGFFWPRQKYVDENAMIGIQKAIQKYL